MPWIFLNIYIYFKKFFGGGWEEAAEVFIVLTCVCVPHCPFNLFLCKNLTKRFKIDEANFCWSVCLSVCVWGSLASDSSETIEVIIIKLSMVAASDMKMHHILIILSLTFIQGHADLNHE